VRSWKASVARWSQRLGGPRVLALPLVRALAVVSALTWLVLAPSPMPNQPLVLGAVLGFVGYSVLVSAALWAHPGVMLRLSLVVFLGDLAFALLLIVATGGARSSLYLALLLLAGLQAYYYGLQRGVAVGLASGAAYLAVIWPTVADIGWADLAIRLLMLMGTALGVGILGRVEEQERLEVVTLTTAAHTRERFIQSVVESLRDGVVALDREGRVVAWNHALEVRYDVPAAEVLGRKFFEIFPSVRSEALGPPLEQLLRGDISEFTLEAAEHHTLRKGRVLQNLKGSLLRQNGQPVGAVLLVEDITDRRLLEQVARQSEKLAALGTLAAGLAHELNNPIGIISSRIELMLLEEESRPLPEETRSDLEVLHRHAQRVARIAQALLSFARQSSGVQRPVDLNDVVEETLLLVERQITRDGIALKRALAPDLPLIRGDGNGLQQVILNLLTNASQAAGAGGEVHVETGPAPDRADRVRLVVRDTGPGIPPEVLPRIFDPFFTTKDAGTGLGLSISYGIVRDHHGTVDVQSGPGRGATFILTFPAIFAASPA
jgi:PAS domain S-box-containing protein